MTTVIHYVPGDAMQPVGTGTRITVLFSSCVYSIAIVYLGKDTYEATVNAPTNDVLEQSLSVIREWAEDRIAPATVHMQMGDDWPAIEPIIKRALSGLDVFVYDLEQKR